MTQGKIALLAKVIGVAAEEAVDFRSGMAGEIQAMIEVFVQMGIEGHEIAALQDALSACVAHGWFGSDR